MVLVPTEVVTDAKEVVAGGKGVVAEAQEVAMGAKEEVTIAEEVATGAEEVAVHKRTHLYTISP